MKYIIAISLSILMTVAINAQDIDSTTRSISLTILAKKERPMRNIVVRSLSNTNAGITDRSGLFVFADMSDNDTLSVLLPRIGETFIPVVGMDSIVVKLRSARRYYYVSNQVQSENFTRRSENFNKIKTEPTDLLDVQEMLKSGSYRSLVDLLQGVAGLNITQASGNQVYANIRGPTSIGGYNVNNSNQPLVVLDGVMIGTITQADMVVNIYDIKIIEVQKNATQWGTFGANGVILIKTW